MSKVGLWSTTAANNNSTPPDGWPEGQAPSTVNDCAREMMAQIRTLLNDMSFVDLGMTPTRTGNTTFTVTGNQTSFFDIGRRVKAFDASTLYGTVISSSFTTNTGITLRLDSGALTTSLSSVAVSVLGNTNHALPQTVYSNKNVVIDGVLDYRERAAVGGVSGSAATAWITDPFFYKQNASASVNISILERSANASNVPTLAQCGLLLNASICISVSAVDAALAGSDYAALGFWVEGYDWAEIAHKPNVLSFWVNSNRTGTYCAALMNGTPDRAYVAEYIISAASTWEKKTITVPEAPTAGTWDYSTGVGLVAVMGLAAGTTFQTTANTWTATIAFATSNQTNFLASAGHTIKFAAFKLEEGNNATPICRETFDKVLARHRRLYEVGIDYNEGYGLADNNISNTIRYTFPKRVSPTAGVSDPATSSGFTAGPTLVSVGTNEMRQFFKKNGVTGYFFWANNWSADAAPSITL